MAQWKRIKPRRSSGGPGNFTLLIAVYAPKEDPVCMKKRAQHQHLGFWNHGPNPKMISFFLWMGHFKST